MTKTHKSGPAEMVRVPLQPSDMQGRRSAARSHTRADKSARDKVHHSSDSDDWTLVTPPQSKSVSPERQAISIPEEAPDGPSELESSNRHQSDSENQCKQIGSKLVRRKTTVGGPDSIGSISNAQTLAKIRTEMHDAHEMQMASDSEQESTSEPEQEDHVSHGSQERNDHLFMLLFNVLLVFVFGMVAYFLGTSRVRSDKLLSQILDSKNQMFNHVYFDPSDHAYTELKLLEEELIECIQRENPNLEGISSWLSELGGRKKGQPPLDFDSVPRLKPIMGMVCYEKEGEWRKRFHRLKTEYNFDLAKTLKRVRNQLTYEMLELHHPTLRFRLIINQLDHLGNLEQRRKDREIEKLKAENFELRRRRASDSQETTDDNSGAQQVASQQNKQSSADSALVSLEGQNRRLRIENEMLKQSLGEKAGTVYIKQSIELEKSERENNALRQFHQQVAQEISKGLRELNVQITDFGAILNDRDESLSARLNQTRGYLMRLVMETSQLAARNKSIQAELNEARLLNAMVVREAQNMMDSENGTSASDHGPTSMRNAISYDSAPLVVGGGAPSDLEAATLRELDSLKCGANSECLATKVNWLMKRAKLRERLRKSQLKANEAAVACDRTSRQGRNLGQKIARRSQRSDGKGSCKDLYA